MGDGDKKYQRWKGKIWADEHGRRGGRKRAVREIGMMWKKEKGEEMTQMNRRIWESRYLLNGFLTHSSISCIYNNDISHYVAYDAA